MRQIIHIIIFLMLTSLSCWSQTETNFDFQEEIETQEYVNINNDNQTLLENIELLQVNVYPPENNKNRDILPAQIHGTLLKRRLIDFKRFQDTLVISFIEYSKPCSTFNTSIDYRKDSTINLKFIGYYEPISCASVAHLFEYIIIDTNKKVLKVLLNDLEIDFSNELYIDEIKIEKKKFLSRKKEIRTYHSCVSEYNLLLSESFDKNGNSIERKIYYGNVEIKK